MEISGDPLFSDILETLPDYNIAFESTREDGIPAYYYRNDRTEQLDAMFGDVIHKIQDLEVTVH